MQSSCITAAPITITCKQFYNPIYPAIWEGFSISIFDSEINSRLIEETTSSVNFDATAFIPSTMPLNNFIVDPANPMISTYSTWTMSLSVNVPLIKECYIKVYLPKDFKFTIDSIESSGIFLPQKAGET